MAGKRAWEKIWPPASAILAVLLVWEAACRLGMADPWVLPAPSAIAGKLIEDADLIVRHVLATLGLAAGGVGLGLACGVAVAVILHLMPAFRAAVTPILLASQNVPIVALGPLLMIWFGFGLTPKLILLTLVCFFPIAWSMLTGLGQSEPHLREYLAMIGASRRDILLKLELPASLPYLFAGLKISVTYSVLAAMFAEWLGASRGIGYYLFIRFKGFDITSVFAAVICIIALCFLLYSLAAALEKRVIYWRRPSRRAGAGELK